MRRRMRRQIQRLVHEEFTRLLEQHITGTGPFGLTGQQVIAKIARSAAKDYLEEREAEGTAQ